MLPGELRLGSEAQLRGELSQDFTSHCRESLIAPLTDAVSKLEVHVPLVYELEEDVSCLLVSVDPEVLLLALEAHAVASRSCAFSSITDIYLKDFSYVWRKHMPFVWH